MRSLCRWLGSALADLPLPPAALCHAAHCRPSSLPPGRTPSPVRHISRPIAGTPPPSAPDAARPHAAGNTLGRPFGPTPHSSPLGCGSRSTARSPMVQDPTACPSPTASRRPLPKVIREHDEHLWREALAGIPGIALGGHVAFQHDIVQSPCLGCGARP